MATATPKTPDRRVARIKRRLSDTGIVSVPRDEELIGALILACTTFDQDLKVTRDENNFVWVHLKNSA